MSSSPKRIVAGNWKMNGDIEKIRQFVESFSSIDNVDCVICPPSIYLNKASTGRFKLGAQNCSEHSKGAFTGELSVEMLLASGCEYVIIGHSERRQYQQESDGLIAAKVEVALGIGLRPILCVGESLETREKNEVFSFVEAQLNAVTDVCGETFIERGVVAYEPIWAIGTGKTATPEQAQEVHAFIRQTLRKIIGKNVTTPILYGGSVNAENAETLFSQPDIDGGLIGGASLQIDSFRKICEAARF